MDLNIQHREGGAGGGGGGGWEAGKLRGCSEISFYKNSVHAVLFLKKVYRSVSQNFLTKSGSTMHENF